MDGTVEPVFEGAPEQVNKLVFWCQTGAAHANITDVQDVLEDPARETSPFRIKYD